MKTWKYCCTAKGASSIAQCKEAKEEEEKEA